MNPTLAKVMRVFFTLAFVASFFMTPWIIEVSSIGVMFFLIPLDVTLVAGIAYCIPFESRESR